MLFNQVSFSDFYFKSICGKKKHLFSVVLDNMMIQFVRENGRWGNHGVIVGAEIKVLVFGCVLCGGRSCCFECWFTGTLKGTWQFLMPFITFVLCILWWDEVCPEMGLLVALLCHFVDCIIWSDQWASVQNLPRPHCYDASLPVILLPLQQAVTEVNPKSEAVCVWTFETNSRRQKSRDSPSRLCK